MKARTQIVMAEVIAGFVALLAVWLLIFRLSGSDIPVLLHFGCLAAAILSTIYFFVLVLNKLRVAKMIYRIWLILAIVPLAIVLAIGMLTSVSWSGYVDFLKAALFSWGSFGLVTLVYWIGLKGLQRAASVEKKAGMEEESKRDEPKDDQKQ